jgi:hypothetical protein
MERVVVPEAQTESWMFALAHSFETSENDFVARHPAARTLCQMRRRTYSEGSGAAG